MAKTYNTPGFYREEVDKSEVAATPGSAIGGVVVRATKGPINRAVLVRTDQEFIEMFGEPMYTSGCSVSGTNPPYTGNQTLCRLVPEQGYGAYAALWFLTESENLNVVRKISSADYYACTAFLAAGTENNTLTSAGVQASTDASNISSPDTANEIDNLDSFILGYAQSDFVLFVGATGPGKDGNNIGVTIETYSSACDWYNAYDEPGLSAVGGQVFKMNVYLKGDTQSWTDTAVAFSAVSAHPVETFYGTLIPVTDATGKQLFIEEVVNGISQYVYVKSNVTTTQRFNHNVVPAAIATLQGGALDETGATGLVATNDGCATEWGFFSSREDVDVNILINPDYDSTVSKVVADIAAARMDCAAVSQVGDLADDTVAEVIAASPTQVTGGPTSTVNSFTNPSYIGFYAGWDRVYDTYNDRPVYLPKAIFAAMVWARTRRVAKPWSAPAGTEWGVLPATDMYRKWNSTEIGQLYDKNINTSRFIRNTGHVLWGQKTGQLKKTALDRINVRMLLIEIENNLDALLSPFLFRNANTTKSRLRMWTIADDYLKGVWAGEGISTKADGTAGYMVVVDDTNNTADVIDANQAIVDVFVQPARTIEVIRLRMTITKTGTSFEEMRA